MNNQDDEVLLKVERLSQHFGAGKSVSKAVNDISFDIKKGEVFGLVGESGCGKTTTGRTIIKLYEATGGNVWLKGQRICAGTLIYNSEIKKAKEQYSNTVLKIKAQYNKDVDQLDVAEKKAVKQKYNEQIRIAKMELKQKIDPLVKEMKVAKNDQKNCDKLYSKTQVNKLRAEFLLKIENAKSKAKSGNEKDIVEFEKLSREYKSQYRIAKKERLVTQIQMIFQDPSSSLNPRMTVREIVAEGLRIKGYRGKEIIDKKVFEMLDLVGLVPEHADRYPHEFSGGQRQRIGIARAIILNPELLIADEPVSALDVSIQAQVITLLNELREKIGLTIMFIAHDISVVKYFSDRIAVMFYGQIMELASTKQLFKNPLHPYTKALLSAVPYPDPLYEKQRKRILYNPLAVHDYSINKPSMHEIVPGHFIYCNAEELQKYKEEYKFNEK